MYYRQTATPNYVIFYYSHSYMFDRVSLNTLYRARTIVNEGGESQIDNFGMSKDETDAFDVFLKEAINDAFSIVVKMTTGLDTDPVFFDDTVVINGVDHTNSYGFKILDEDAFNDNVLYTVDDGIRKYLDAHILAGWYSLVGHDGELAKWLAKKQDARTDLLNKRLFQLMKPKIATY